MKTIINYALLALSIFTVVLIMVFSGNKYNWINEVDPTFSSSDFENSGARQVFLNSLLVFTLVFQALNFYFVKLKTWKLLALVQSILVLLVWFLCQYR